MTVTAGTMDRLTGQGQVVAVKAGGPVVWSGASCAWWVQIKGRLQISIK